MTTGLFDSFLTIVTPSLTSARGFEVTSYQKGQRLANGEELTLHIQAFNDYFNRHHLNGPVFTDPMDASKMVIQMAYLSNLGSTIFSNLNVSCLLALPEQQYVSSNLYHKILHDAFVLGKFDMVSVGSFSYRGKKDFPEVLPLLDFDPTLEGMSPLQETLSIYVSPPSKVAIKKETY